MYPATVRKGARRVLFFYGAKIKAKIVLIVELDLKIRMF